MDLNEVKAIVNHEDTKRYRVTMLNGKTRIVRLWLHKDGCVAIMGKGRKHYGHYLSNYSWDDLNDWVTLKLIEHNEIDYYKRFVKRATDALKMLTESGLWTDIKQSIEHFFALTESEQRELVNDIITDSYEKFYKQTWGDGKYAWVHCHQVFETFVRKKCWQSIPWRRYEREHMNAIVADCIKNGKDFSRRWENGYDNTIEIANRDGEKLAWLSLEYRGCGNGHYYLMFDATHAIFYEND